MDKPRLVVLDCSLNHLISVEIPIWSSDWYKTSITLSFRQNAQSMEALWYLPVCVGGVIAWPRIHYNMLFNGTYVSHWRCTHRSDGYTAHKKLWDSWPILLKHAWASIDETVSLLLSRSVTDHLTWHEQCYIQCSQSVPTYSENWTATPTC